MEVGVLELTAKDPQDVVLAEVRGPMMQQEITLRTTEALGPESRRLTNKASADVRGFSSL